MRFAPITAATVADHPIVAASAGRKVRVLAYLIVAAGAVVVTWKSNTTALSGAMTMATGIPNTSPPGASLDPMPCLETVHGEALNLALAGAVQVSGWVVYDYVV